MKIIAVIGARPQFIKHAPIEIAFRDTAAELVTIHTGQHYDENMSKIFFDELGMRSPKYMLQIGSASHGAQTGRMLADIEAILLDERPDAVLVYGDTNSTLAGALAAAKLHIPVIHLEAGLRSFNKEMPEEINRILTDHVSNLLFAPTETAVANLAKENIREGVRTSGDVMCDMIAICGELGLPGKEDAGTYYYSTIHRPYNTDDKERLHELLSSFDALDAPVVLSIHPRTRHKMKEFGLDPAGYGNIRFLDPVSYFENVAYQRGSKAVITDSGGMQKEAYMLRRKCVTIRPETEWVETLANGWNTLCFSRLQELQELLRAEPGGYTEDLYGDGKAAVGITSEIVAYLSGRK